IREQAGVKGGEALEVRLELDDQPREVALPSDFEKLLNKHPEAKKFFETLSYSNKQRHVLPIGQAKTDETRQRRIDKAISDLLAKKK
ncbi:MAG TPA: YdeI/OmpD-associated family protein, partial [Flavitalea sp.]|nr:YdeI/OmpD-associated family protein [Flavitalea sp.]